MIVNKRVIHKEKMNRKKELRKNGNPLQEEDTRMWKYKTCRNKKKTVEVKKKKKKYEAVKEPLDLTLGENRTLIGYNYLEYV
jgi:hypothetical protein